MSCCQIIPYDPPVRWAERPLGLKPEEPLPNAGEHVAADRVGGPPPPGGPSPVVCRRMLSNRSEAIQLQDFLQFTNRKVFYS